MINFSVSEKHFCINGKNKKLFTFCSFENFPFDIFSSLSFFFQFFSSIKAFQGHLIRVAVFIFLKPLNLPKTVGGRKNFLSITFFILLRLFLFQKCLELKTLISIRPRKRFYWEKCKLEEKLLTSSNWWHP